MPSESAPVVALTDPEVLALPKQIVAGFAPGDDPKCSANALTVLSLRVATARRGLDEDTPAEVVAALDRLNVEILSAMETFHRLTDETSGSSR